MSLALSTTTIRRSGLVAAATIALACAGLAAPGAIAQDASPDGTALPALVPGTAVTGTIDASGERDAYALTIDPADTASLLDARLIVPTGPARRMCVERPPVPGTDAVVATRAACASGEGGAVLRDLLLAPGGYQVLVDGDNLLRTRTP